ncbi:MAG: hypothetical protein WB676_13095, partial [Bryobacteraceae bacterium]
VENCRTFWQQLRPFGNNERANAAFAAAHGVVPCLTDSLKCGVTGKVPDSGPGAFSFAVTRYFNQILQDQ